MQLGTRWAMGAEPPARLPDAVVEAIREVEDAAGTGSEASGRGWTLTWLEGRPFVELDPASGSENGTVIRYSPASGTASIASGDSGEEWVEEEL